MFMTLISTSILIRIEIEKEIEYYHLETLCLIQYLIQSVDN